MILVKVEDYCQQCLDFTPDVTKPEKYYAGTDEIILGDTIVQCEYRRRCASIKRYLELQSKSEVSG